MELDFVVWANDLDETFSDGLTIKSRNSVFQIVDRWQIVDESASMG